jgi:hypothetical protein
MRFFFKLLTLVFLILLYTGCSRINLLLKDNEASKTELFSCEQKAKPKSLQFLEQQYRCKSQN